MADLLTVARYPLRPGAVQITVNATGTALRVDRLDATGPSALRSAPKIVSGSLVEFVDVEASFHEATYRLWDGNRLLATAVISLPPLASGRALLRSVLRLDDEMAVSLVDEVNMAYATSTAIHAIIGTGDPIAISDVRRRRAGTYILATRNIQEADRLLSLLADGNPLLMRTCPDPAHPARDGYFYALNVGEARWGRKGVRLFDVDYQTVSAVKGELALPAPVTKWTYDDLAKQTTATTYGDLPALREDYFDLYMEPVQ